MSTYPFILMQAEIVNLIDLTVVYDCASNRLLYDEGFKYKAHAMMDLETWTGSYYHGYREPRYPVPAVWRQRGFMSNFEFYVQRGFVNAMFDAAIERDKGYASRINRRK